MRAWATNSKTFKGPENSMRPASRLNYGFTSGFAVPPNALHDALVKISWKRNKNSQSILAKPIVI